jgi:predicted DNA repair protein MutK
MFLVGGGILAHGIPWVAHAVEDFAAKLAGIANVGPVLATVTPLLANLAVGLVAGALAVAVFELLRKFRPAAAH